MLLPSLLRERKKFVKQLCNKYNVPVSILKLLDEHNSTQKYHNKDHCIGTAILVDLHFSHIHYRVYGVHPTRQRNAFVAALLHDLGHSGYFHQGYNDEQNVYRSIELARPFLEQHFDPESIREINSLILSTEVTRRYFNYGDVVHRVLLTSDMSSCAFPDTKRFTQGLSREDLDGVYTPQRGIDFYKNLLSQGWTTDLGEVLFNTAIHNLQHLK